ncbi:MAG: ABC transporter ATP-binding protein [Bdellovibrionales bacterium]|nr:ABC transporter ATP-binding protein [Bdellovibrionales bacterium]
MSSLSAPAFELKQVRHEFQSSSGTPLEVLRDINLQVQRGQRIAILGPSGSGKSTLLSIIAGLQKPTSGSVIWNGRNITSLSERDLSSLRASSVALVFQQFLLVPHLTALENVSLPLELQGMKRAIARERAILQLETYGLQERAQHFPRMLSGGECQRVAIARAVIVEPTLLLADEPTGNLDPSSAKAVFEQLIELPKLGKVGALVLVTHNEELAERCDHRYRLHFGDLRLLSNEGKK